jgi:DDE superfamily endonuclease
MTNLILMFQHLNTCAFEPAEAKRIFNKIEFRYTPKHGSWLNMAEIEFSVLACECLDRRIPDQASLKTEIAAWEKRRNNLSRTVDWQFTTTVSRAASPQRL